MGQLKPIDLVGIKYTLNTKGFTMSNRVGDIVEICNIGGQLVQGETHPNVEELIKHRIDIQDCFVFNTPQELFKWLSE